MKKIIDLNKTKVKDHCLNWTASDVAYQLEDFVTLEPLTGKDYKIIDEPTEEHREDLQGIMQDAIYENQDKIIGVINDALWDYLVENKKEIIETLIDNKYIDKLK
jgi:hypothetical protein|tara:strand:+ start:443 stop:757 length:315 start_codon:yes stop_codon:yes gene_type:complete